LTIQDPDTTAKIYGIGYNYDTNNIAFAGGYETGGNTRSFVGLYCNGCGTGSVFHMVKWLRTLTLSDTLMDHYGYSVSYS
jgi:hypothetical protein